MIPVSADQLRAYARAVYEVELDGDWIEASVLGLAGNPWPAALISACNPFSQRLPEAENAMRQQQLQQQIEAGGWRCWPARGRATDSSWVEPGFLVLAPLAQVDAWGRAFGQHAVWVQSAVGSPASLRVYSPYAGARKPSQELGMRVDWVADRKAPTD